MPTDFTFLQWGAMGLLAFVLAIGAYLFQGYVKKSEEHRETSEAFVRELVKSNAENRSEYLLAWKQMTKETLEAMSEVTSALLLINESSRQHEERASVRYKELHACMDRVNQKVDIVLRHLEE